MSDISANGLAFLEKNQKAYDEKCTLNYVPGVIVPPYWWNRELFDNNNHRGSGKNEIFI